MTNTHVHALRGFSIGAVLALAGFIGGRDAEATPIYSISAGNACDTCHVEPIGWENPETKKRTCTLSCQGCHVSPVGGAMRTPSGQYFATEFLPQFTAGARPSEKVTTDPMTRLGEGAPSEGKFRLGKGFAGWWPGTTPPSTISDRYGGIKADPVFKAGGDVRWMFYFPSAYSAEEANDPATFPMQSDLYLFGRVQKHVALYASFGLMGSRNDGDVSDGDFFTYQTFKSYVANRELFVKVDKLPYNSYVLAGRFNIPYGWRIPDHTSYVRRNLGFDENRQVFGVMAGTNPNYPFVNVAAFYQTAIWPGDTPAAFAEDGTVLSSDSGYGVAVTGGIRELGWQIAGSAMAYRRRTGYDDLTFGPQYAINFYPITFLGEFDIRRQTDPGISVIGMFSYNEIDYRIFNPLVAKLKFDWYDADVRYKDDHKNRFTAGVEYHPFTYTSIEMQYRRNYDGGSVAYVGSTFTGQEILIMLHGYL